MRWVVVTLVVFILSTSAAAVESTGDFPDYPIITEIQTASHESATEEFVEIYNPTDLPIELDSWELQYKSADGVDWTAKATLEGQVEPRGYLLLATNDYLTEFEGQNMTSGLASTDGHVRFVYVDEMTGDVVFDTVGWGSADSPEGDPAEAPFEGESLKRMIDVETVEYIDSDDNSSDFWISSEPDPEHTIVPEPEDNHVGDENVDEDEEIEYLPILLSELLVDPDMPLSDADDEFVELYNPNNESVDLEGYVLQTGSSYSYDFILPSIVMQPQQYLALYSSDTGLVLANSGGASRILDPNQKVLDSTTYGAAKPDLSWSLIGAKWQFSLRSTPNAPNELVESESTETPRNEANSLKPCASNQFRNPETNRCKLIATGSSLKPCAPDEFRNPETNRCKKNVGDNASKPGSSGSAQEVLAATSEQKVSTPDFTAVALVGGAALLYSLYEFRYDIRNRFHQSRGYFTDRFFRRKSP